MLSSTGSMPFKPGAMMGIDALGKGYGTIGSGCSEAAIMVRARKIMGTGTSCIIKIDMANEVTESEGMVCGGTLRVLPEDAATIEICTVCHEASKCQPHLIPKNIAMGRLRNAFVDEAKFSIVVQQRFLAGQY